MLHHFKARRSMVRLHYALCSQRVTWASEWPSNLCKASQLVRGGGRVQIQTVWPTNRTLSSRPLSFWGSSQSHPDLPIQLDKLNDSPSPTPSQFSFLNCRLTYPATYWTSSLIFHWHRNLRLPRAHPFIFSTGVLTVRKASAGSHLRVLSPRIKILTSLVC